MAMLGPAPAPKYCFVPGCLSTTFRNPNKQFLCVPRNPEKRKLWCQAVGRGVENTRGTVYCCEDHFDLKEDVRNFHVFEKIRGKKNLRDGVLPRFNLDHSHSVSPSLHGGETSQLVSCANREKQNEDGPEQQLFHPKRPKLHSEGIVYEVDSSNYSFDHQSIDLCLDKNDDIALLVSGNCVSVEMLPYGAGEAGVYLAPKHVSSTSSQLVVVESRNNTSTETVVPLGAEEVASSFLPENVPTLLPLPSVEYENDMISDEIIPSGAEETEIALAPESEASSLKLMTDVGVTTDSVRKEDKGTMCVPTTADAETQVKMKGLRIAESVQDGDIFNTSADTVESFCTDTSYSQPSQNGTTTTSNSSERDRHFQFLQDKVYENMTKKVIEHDPILFLGIPEDSMYILKIISEKTNLPLKNIYLTLKKIRQNHTNATLAYDFGYSERHIGRIFTATVTVLVEAFRKLIIWPSKEIIQKNLPITFRNKFEKVQSIIDCLGVQIEKPSNAVHQAASWSDYKKCNSVKYGLSITPSCNVNWVSKGYGGRTTDTHIIEDSGYLEILSRNSEVLADRGFKRLSPILEMQGCKLVCPVSVKDEAKCSEQEVRHSREISSCRIHVERVIERIREFRFLDIHSTVDSHYFPILDDIVVIVCGLVNIQGRVLKQ